MMHKTVSGRWEPDRPAKSRPITKTEQKILDYEARLAHSYDLFLVHKFTHVSLAEGCCYCSPDQCPHPKAPQDDPWHVLGEVELKR